jgi:hypothetical protein
MFLRKCLHFIYRQNKSICGLKTDHAARNLPDDLLGIELWVLYCSKKTLHTYIKTNPGRNQTSLLYRLARENVNFTKIYTFHIQKEQIDCLWNDHTTRQFHGHFAWVCALRTRHNYNKN